MAPTIHVSRHGLWLLIDDEEFLLAFEHFPWFRHATIEQLSLIERPASDHLYWPLLDVDLAVQSIRNPSDFPPSFRRMPANQADLAPGTLNSMLKQAGLKQ